MAATWLRVSTGRVCAQPATSPMTSSFWREDPLLTVETHGSSWIGLGWLVVRSVEAEKMLLEVQSATICIFLADLRWIWAKPTISKQNNTGSLPDLSKTYRILAKNYQIFFWIWEKLTRFVSYLSKTHWIVAGYEWKRWDLTKNHKIFIGFERKSVCFRRIGGRSSLLASQIGLLGFWRRRSATRPVDVGFGPLRPTARCLYPQVGRFWFRWLQVGWVLWVTGGCG